MYNKMQAIFNCAKADQVTIAIDPSRDSILESRPSYYANMPQNWRRKSSLAGLLEIFRRMSVHEYVRVLVHSVSLFFKRCVCLDCRLIS